MVLGFFAITVISPGVVNTIHPGVQVFNMAAAGIAVGILITPLIASVAEDALHAVPDALREASYGLGARRLATSMRVVVPAAISGIVAALILGVSRAIGETMIVAIAAGATGGSLFTINPFDAGITMTAAITALATGSDQVHGADLAFPSLFFVGLLLFVVHPRLEPAQRRVRPPGSAALLMAATTTDAPIERRHRRGRSRAAQRDVATGAAWSRPSLLLLTLIVSLTILFVLAGRRAWSGHGRFLRAVDSTSSPPRTARTPRSRASARPSSARSS